MAEQVAIFHCFGAAYDVAPTRLDHHSCQYDHLPIHAPGSSRYKAIVLLSVLPIHVTTPTAPATCCGV